MEKMKKLLALLLALAMVFCLAACGADNDDDDSDKDDKSNSSVENKDDDDSSADKKDDDDDSADKKDETDAEKILGEWVCRFDLSDALGEVLADAIGDDSVIPNTSLYMDLELDFDDDEFTLSAEVDKDSLVDYMDDLGSNMIDYLYDMAEDEGMSREEFEATIEAENGMTLEEFVEDQLEQSIEDATDDLSFEVTGNYIVDEDEGYIYVGEDDDELDSKEEAMTYKFSGSKLTITGIISDGEEVDDPLELESMGIEFPWKFDKK